MQDGDLAQATDHVTVVKIEQIPMHPSPGQVLDTGQRLRLSCLDGISVMVRV